MKKTFMFLIMICFTSVKFAFAEQPLIQRIGFKPSISDSTYRNWVYLINRLYDGETNKVLKYDSEIKIMMTGNPTNSDTIIVTNLINELISIISTNKVALVKSGGNLILRFTNGPGIQNLSMKTFNGLGRDFKNENRPKIKTNMPPKLKASLSRYDSLEKNQTEILFRFNDSLNFSSRKRYIEYEVIQSLCVIRQTVPIILLSKEPILNRPYGNINPLNTNFSVRDKFLLKKLYSTDFQKQLKDYIIKGSSWHNYMILTRKSVMRSLGLLIVILITILILAVTYKPIFRRQFKSPYYEYLLKGIVISTSIYILHLVFLWFTASTFSKDILIKILNLLFYALFTTVFIATPLYILEKYLIKPNLNRTTQAALKILFVLAIFLILSFLGNHFSISLNEQFIDFISIGIILAIGRGILMYIDNAESIAVLIKDSEIKRLKELKAEAEMRSLQSRINPHFLYNSLNSIAGLAHSNPDKTERMALALAELFRYNISRKIDLFDKIKDELKLIRSFLEIEQIRFGDRLKYKIDISEELEEKLMPRNLLQPIVENAIIHGISRIQSNGEIHITFTEENNNICLIVKDNGPQFPENLISGFGLQSIFDMLDHLYGESAKINWENTPSKCIKISFPERTN